MADSTHHNAHASKFEQDLPKAIKQLMETDDILSIFNALWRKEEMRGSRMTFQTIRRMKGIGRGFSTSNACSSLGSNWRIAVSRYLSAWWCQGSSIDNVKAKIRDKERIPLTYNA
jgi:hypothetical protein